MGLWDPGTVEGFTAQVALAVARAARRDHSYAGGCDLLPHSMPIREVAAIDAASGDGAFDRVSHARATGETFWLESHRWRVIDYHGRPWRVECVTASGAVGSSVAVGTVRADIEEATLARMLTSANGAHPNPYVCRVEVAYNRRGNVAGYGVRRDGTLSLWYD